MQLKTISSSTPSLQSLLGTAYTSGYGIGTVVAYKRLMQLPITPLCIWQNWISEYWLNKPRFVLHTAALNTANCSVTFKQAQFGITTAHHYPSRYLPRHASLLIPAILVRTTSSKVNKPTDSFFCLATMSNFIFKQYVSNKLSLVFCWNKRSPLSSPHEIQRWKKELGSDIFKDITYQCPIQIIHLNTDRLSVVSRTFQTYLWNKSRTYQASDEMMSTETNHTSFMIKTYSLNLLTRDDWEIQRRLHLYHPYLLSVLLIDKHGYIRWHCVGTVTNEAIVLLQQSMIAVAAER